MQPLSRKNAAILEILTEGLEGYAGRKIDNTGGVYLPVSVQHIGGGSGEDDPQLYSVAHYIEQNGDLCADPDIEFLHAYGSWYPVACQQILGYSRAVELDANGEFKGYRPRAYRELRQFAGILLSNIVEQQGLKVRRAS